MNIVRCTNSEESRAIHPIADVQDEIRRRARDAVPVRHFVKRLPQLRMIGHERLDVLQPPAGRLQRLLEFELGLGLRLAERHLHAAVRVDLAFP